MKSTLTFDPRNTMVVYQADANTFYLFSFMFLRPTNKRVSNCGGEVRVSVLEESVVTKVDAGSFS